MERGLNFGQAVEAMRNGRMVARDNATWAAFRKCFVFMQVPSIINKQIVPKMQSLPPSVKAEFFKRFNDPKEQIDEIYYDNQLAIVYPSNLICGYSPSPEDALAIDWYTLD